MMSESERLAVAFVLAEARRKGEPIAPLTETWPGFDVADAYAVQSLLVKSRVDAGASVVGWKVGLTSVAMQRQFGVDEPDFGPLLDEMELRTGSGPSVSSLISPRVEAELAFRLATNLKGPDIGLLHVTRATESVLPALEIIDSRIVDWQIKLPDTVADHASCSSFILGERAVELYDCDIDRVAVSILEDGRELEAGVGAAILGSPLRAVAWLANTLAPYGEELRAGQVILAGAMHASIPLRPGSMVEARYSDPGLGSVSIRCN